MNIKKDITILIPTHNRYHLLKRLLWAFNEMSKLNDASIPLNIVIADSSTDPIPTNFLLKFSHLTVNYKKYPNDKLPIKKLFEASGAIKTKYVTPCADDDFTILSSALHSADFLEKNRDFHSCHGWYVSFQIFNNQFLWDPLYQGQTSEESDSPSSRLQSHFTNHTTPTFWATYRTKSYTQIMKIASEHVSNWGLSELLPLSLSIAIGKMKILPLIYSLRDGENAGLLLTDKSQWYSPELIQKSIVGLAKLVQLLEPTYSDSDQLSKKIFDFYLKDFKDQPTFKPVNEQERLFKLNIQSRKEMKIQNDAMRFLRLLIINAKNIILPNPEFKKNLNYINIMENPFASAYKEIRIIKEAVLNHTGTK